MRRRDGDPARAFYDRISRAYDLLADASEHAAREQGLALLACRPGERVLEIGCGTGHALSALAGALAGAGCAVGVDLSSGMLAVARRHLASADAGDRVTLVHGDARSLPCATDAFDAVFLSFTLELFGGDTATVLAELRRALRPRGRLAVVSLFADEHPGALVELYRWLHRHFPHVIDCEPIPVDRILDAAGFAVEASEDTSIATLPVRIVVARPTPT